MSIDARALRRWLAAGEGGEAALAAAMEFRAGQLAAGLQGGAESEAEGRVLFREDAAMQACGFRVDAAPGRLVIEGRGRRELMDGAAWLRRKAGLLTPRPGLELAGEAAGEVAEGRYDVRPAFAERGIVLGCDGLHEAWRDWLPFASRNGLTSVFFHDTPPSRWEAQEGDGAGRMFALWDREGGEIAAEARRLGLRLEFGGHHLSTLLPREAFAQHPEWFPLREGERQPRHNLCVSDAGARAALQEGARRFFARFPGFAVYHLWADDLRAGGWCACGGCAGMTPSDQALEATNLVAEALERVDPAAQVAHLAYHDTLEAPQRVRPRENVAALWAPRNRCYAHALDDGGCRRNREHLAGLERLAAWFGGPERVRVFEYYSDGILFKWMAPPLLEVIPGDLAAYARLGVGAVLDLAVAPRPWTGPAWHGWWFARCAWDGGGDPAAGLEEFTRGCFGELAGAFAAMYRRLDAACGLLLERGDLEPGPRFDVLDYGDSPRAELRALAGRTREALAEFAAAAQALPVAVRAGLPLEAVDELAPTAAAGMHLAGRVIAWDAALDGRREEAVAHLRMADVHLRALVDWYHAHARPAWETLGEPMLRGARWHTDRVRALCG
ncbi:DUF4838 domain-containing protein [Tepidiforma sp.]|uniref:DUF4838 domain-containing protein n=1 Tax=Tepidiforma sp. TaxID=2682230 RepID=UPI00262CF645|nr:DUF4838 domain-containing protein [Tepidiforma sp.]MCX7617360.1 DUF4838 domain-containing protein [Tepidiforma sp.]